MFLGRVVGEVVATIKHGDLRGHKLLLVQPVDPEGVPRGQAVLAVDSVQAGESELVLVVDEGNSAAQVFRRSRGPVRTVVVGVVDEVDRTSAQAGPEK